MFSIYTQRPFIKHQRRNRFPCFVDFACQDIGQPELVRHNDTELNQSRNLHFPIIDLLQMVEECHHSKSNKSQRDNEGKENPKEINSTRKRQSDSPSEEGNESITPKRACPPHTIDDAVSLFGVLKNGRQPNDKWQHKLDCRGFESNNIRIKIESRVLLIKAFKKEMSEHGIRTSSMRKNVTLPEYVDAEKIKCKLSPDQFLIIEAPILDKQIYDINEIKDNKKNYLKGLMALILPEWGALLEHHPCGPASEKEKTTEKSQINASMLEKSNANEKETLDSTKIPIRLDDKKSTEEENEKEASEMSAVENHKPEQEKTIRVKEVTRGENVTLPKDDDEDMSTHDDDVDSNNSDDSFVLLSKLQKENNECDNNSSENVSPSEKVQENVKTNEPTEGDSFKKSHDISTTGSNTISTPDPDNNDQWEFRLEMPSYSPESFKVDFEDSKKLLTIVATKEGSSGTESVVKNVNISDNVDASGLQCSLRDGMLSVKAPYKKALRSVPISL